MISDMTPDITSGTLNRLMPRFVSTACSVVGRHEPPEIVVSPYRFNPLGAHVDHQGGDVLARTIDQYTMIAFWPTPQSSTVTLHSALDADAIAQFIPGEQHSTANWMRYAEAAMATLAQHYQLRTGLTGYVDGTLIGAGLSSSASVILAYLTALAHVNEIQLDQPALIELSRVVENTHMGLNNGVQDQMSIAFGQSNALVRLHMETRSATPLPDPANRDSVNWYLCYSGFSRELISSGFNTRVQECREAATQLSPQAHTLGDVNRGLATTDAINALPTQLAGRARHYFSETTRVAAGATAWTTGDFLTFGQLMNESCRSSINDYESGSEPLIQLHQLALDTPGVYGSRFSGGGYGGCLIMLVDNDDAERHMQTLFDRYLRLHPDKKGLARLVRTESEDSVRVLAPLS